MSNIYFIIYMLALTIIYSVSYTRNSVYIDIFIGNLNLLFFSSL